MNHFTIKAGKILVFKDGEEWMVEPHSISTHGYISGGKELRIKPHNAIAKKHNGSMSATIDEQYFKAEVLEIK